VIGADTGAEDAMEQSDRQDQTIKRIVLPSGKTIEVVHFHDTPVTREEPQDGTENRAPAAEADRTDELAREALDAAAHADEIVVVGRVPAEGPDAAAVESLRELHVCPECGSNLVYPTKWSEADPEHWHVTLRCPSCEYTESGTFHQALADRFDEELERGTQAIVRDLRRLTRANMAEEIDRFVAALDADGIQPMDF
jgi:hypothetical protein